MAVTDQDTIYELLVPGADFNGEGYEVLLSRPSLSAGSRGTLRRLAFIDVDVDPTDGFSELTAEVTADGNSNSRQTKTISTQEAGSAYRRKISWRLVGRWFNLAYRFSSGTGSIDQIGDSAGDVIGDSAGNILGGTGESVRFFRLLGQTFGIQSLGSRRR